MIIRKREKIRFVVILFKILDVHFSNLSSFRKTCLFTAYDIIKNIFILSEMALRLIDRQFESVV